MIVNCPKCQASYQIADSLIGEAGRKVKCSKCGNNWHQTLNKKEQPKTLNNKQETKPKTKPKSKGLDWVAEEASVKESKFLEKEIQSENAPPNSLETEEDDDKEIEIDLDFIKEEPEIYIVPSLPEDKITILINKYKQLFKKNLVYILLFVFLNFFWFARFKIVEFVPQIRPVYDILRIKSVKIGEGLIFKNVTRKKIYENDELFLEVRGYVLNVDLLKEQIVHLIEVQLYDNDGRFLAKSSAEPQSSLLKSGASTSFVVKLKNPPKETAYVITTFHERGR